MSDTITLEDAKTLRVGDRRWPVSYTEVEDYDMPDVATSRPVAPQHRRQAIIAFESGWAVSVLWGSMTHSDNHDSFYEGDPYTDEPCRVEVGILYRDEGLVGDPLPYVLADVLNDLLDAVSGFTDQQAPEVAWRIAPIVGAEE